MGFLVCDCLSFHHYSKLLTKNRGNFFIDMKKLKTQFDPEFSVVFVWGGILGYQKNHFFNNLNEQNFLDK